MKNGDSRGNKQRSKSVDRRQSRPSDEEDMEEENNREKRPSIEGGKGETAAQKRQKIDQEARQIFEGPEEINFYELNKKTRVKKLCVQTKYQECDVVYFKNPMAECDAAKLEKYLLNEILPQMKPQNQANPSKSRKILWYGPRYCYATTSLEANEKWDPIIEETRQWIEESFNVPINSCLINYYKDGSVTIGAHSDDEEELGKEPNIISLSLGADRQMLFRNKNDRSLVDKVVLVHGSILQMGGKTQELLTHELPADQAVHSGRFNLTFRFTKPRIEFFEGGMQNLEELLQDRENEETEEAYRTASNSNATILRNNSEVLTATSTPHTNQANHSRTEQRSPAQQAEQARSMQQQQDTQQRQQQQQSPGTQQQQQQQSPRVQQQQQQTQQNRDPRLSRENQNNHVTPIIFETAYKDPVGFQRWLQRNFPGTRIKSVQDLRYSEGYIVYPCDYKDHQELLHTVLKNKDIEGAQIHRRLPKNRPTNRRESYQQHTQQQQQTSQQQQTGTTQKTQHHTFIMTGINVHINTHKMAEDLQSAGHEIKGMVRIKSARTGQDTPLVRIFTNNLDYKKRCLEQGIRLGYQVFNCVESRTVQPVIQCYNCQGFGHTQRDCDAPITCKNCGRAHDSRNCQDPDEVKCINCGEAHAATYKGCISRIRAINKQNQQNQRPPSNEQSRPINTAGGGWMGAEGANFPLLALGTTTAESAQYATRAREHWSNLRNIQAERQLRDEQLQQLRYQQHYQEQQRLHQQRQMLQLDQWQRQQHQARSRQNSRRGSAHQAHQAHGHSRSDSWGRPITDAGVRGATEPTTPERRTRGEDVATMTSPPVTIPLPPSSLIHLVACTMIQLSAVLGNPLTVEQTCQMAVNIVGGVTGAVPTDMDRHRDLVQDFWNSLQ